MIWFSIIVVYFLVLFVACMYEFLWILWCMWTLWILCAFLYLFSCLLWIDLCLCIYMRVCVGVFVIVYAFIFEYAFVYLCVYLFRFLSLSLCIYVWVFMSFCVHFFSNHSIIRDMGLVYPPSIRFSLWPCAPTPASTGDPFPPIDVLMFCSIYLLSLTSFRMPWHCEDLQMYGI